MPVRKLRPVEANDGSYAGLVLAAWDRMEAEEEMEKESGSALVGRSEGVGFTPGPWRALCLKQYTRVTRDSQGPHDQTGGVQICHIAGPDDEGYEGMRPFNKARWDADARLIAAAPDLLTALRDIIEIGKRDLSNPKYDAYFAEARAALAKAGIQ